MLFEISLDMLVGNEHRQRIISPKLPSIQLYGMYCPKTVFDDIVLSGTIPGPGSISANISNNIVTIFNFSCLKSDPSKSPSKPEHVPEVDVLKTANLPQQNSASSSKNKQDKIKYGN